jgi:HPt (histidine-containing phosphotransfer) domain-containing protein
MPATASASGATIAPIDRRDRCDCDQPMNPPHAADPARPTLDATALTKLRELDPSGKAGVVKRVVGAYERSLVQFVSQLRHQLDRPDAGEVARIAHTLKSSSTSVGALSLARLCQALEQRLREGGAAQTHDVQRLIDEAEAALAAARAILGR